MRVRPRRSRGRHGFGLAAALATGVLVVAAGVTTPGPAQAREIHLKCRHELASRPALWVFDTDTRTSFFDDGKRVPATVTINETQITMKQVEEQPICHLGKGCTDGKQVTEYTTIINRRAGTYLVYCKNVQDDGKNWKPGQNCFPQGPNKGTCDKN